MPASLNKFIGLGNLTRDPELHYIPPGAPVCNFDLAFNRSYTTQGGQKKDEVCFMTIVVWGKQVEDCGQYLKKGRQVLVEGHLQQRSWKTPEGQKRTKVEIVAERVQFVGSNTNGNAAGAGASAEAEGVGSPVGVDEVPF